MTIRPLGNRVLVRPDKPEEKSKGGILIPDRAQGESQTGLVLAVGPGRVSETAAMAGQVVPVAVKKGDRVLYSRYAGSKAKELGDDILLSEDDILGVVYPDRPSKDECQALVDNHPRSSPLLGEGKKPPASLEDGTEGVLRVNRPEGVKAAL